MKPQALYHPNKRPSPPALFQHQHPGKFSRRTLRITRETGWASMPNISRAMKSCPSLRSLRDHTSNYLPAPAATSPTTAATTSPDYQRLPVLHQQPSPTPVTRSCTNYQFLDFTNWHPLYDFLLWFAIIKSGLSKQPPCFVILAWIVYHLYFKSLWDRYIYRPRNKWLLGVMEMREGGLNDPLQIVH